MKPKSENHKTAIKLANQYAESYKVLELENRSLKKELEDVAMSLSINKSMITDLTNPIKLSTRDKVLVDGLKKENITLNSQIQNLRTENGELKRLINLNQNNLEPILSKNQKLIDNLSNKIFVLENTIIKKDNTIKQLNNKLDEAIYCKIVGNNALIQEVAVSRYIKYNRLWTLIKPLF